MLIMLIITMPTRGAVLVKDKMWPRHSTLNVVFIDGTAEQKQLVKQFAPLWLEGSSLSFEFYDGFSQAPKQSHIRISFNLQTGSSLGNHGDLISREPTMQLAELGSKDLPEVFARRLILHEFGHALGFEHEFRNPKWPYGNAAIEKQIIECVPRVQRLGLEQKSAQQRCRQINQLLTKNATNSTIYDELSIMNYPMVIDLPNQQKKRIEAKTQLSVLDKLAMERWYGQ